MKTCFVSVENGEWEHVAAEIIRSRMKAVGVNFVQLSRLLRSFGFDEHNKSLSGRVNRGRFTAAFMLQCMSALDAVSIEIPKRAEPRTEAE